MPSFERGAYQPSDDVRVYDAAEDDEQEEEGSRLPLLIVIGLLVFAAFAGVVWLAYTQGVQRGLKDAPRTIVAEQGPVKTQPANAGGTTNPYAGLKIYQQPAPADDSDNNETPPQPSTPVGQGSPAISPSLAPVIRQAPSSDTASTQAAQKPSAVPTAPQKPVAVASNVAPTPIKPAPVVTKPVPAVTKPAPTPPTTEPANDNRVATKAPAKLSVVTDQASAPVAVPAATQPAPAAVPAMQPVEKNATTGGYVLQIGSYKSEDEANAAWKAYQAKHPLVGGYEPNIKKVDLAGKGTWYRLRLGAFADTGAANTFCAKLKADGGDCIPSKE